MMTLNYSKSSFYSLEIMSHASLLDSLMMKTFSFGTCKFITKWWL